jgi:structural maintenance of chromosome 3 (chondroitin sulfate proteoglycan 6)
MLKEVTGTESFDSRVEKMSSVLNECNTKKEQMNKILDAIKARLDQLGQEIEEYREIQKLEKEKKALEMALHQLKMMNNNTEMEKLRAFKS